MPKSPILTTSRMTLEKWFPILLLVWVGFVFFHFFRIRSIFDFTFLSEFVQGLGFIDLKKCLGNAIESAKVLEIAIDEAGAAKRGVPQAATQTRAMVQSTQTRCIPKIAIHEVGRAQVAAGKSATIQARDSAAS